MEWGKVTTSALGPKKSQDKGAYPCVVELSEGSNNLLPGFSFVLLVTQGSVESLSGVLSEPQLF